MQDFRVSGLQYIGYIVSRTETDKRVAAATFINQCNCLIARFWAIKIKRKEEHYIAESPALLGREKYEIHSVLHKNVDDDVAAYWGVVKVSYKI